MANYKTPGVYIEEIATLGSSVAAVPTAIPGFVGYTEKAVFPDGSSAANVPVRITSLLEYQQYFGGPYKELFNVTLTGVVPTPANITTAPASSLSVYILFYQMQMFFANGGGICYVVSVGSYSNGGSISNASLKNGLDKLEQIDEVTLLVIPETVNVTSSAADIKEINNRMLIQCNKLQDRFAILDVLKTNSGANTDATSFRSSYVGSDYLKYGAAYYPPLDTPMVYAYDDSAVVIDDQRTMGSAPYNYTYDNAHNNSLSTVFNGISSFGTITIVTNSSIIPANTVTISGTALVPNTDFMVGANGPATAANLINAINNSAVLSLIVTASQGTTTSDVLVQAKIMGAAGNYTVAIGGTTPPITFTSTSPNTALTGGKDNSADIALYNRIKAELAKYTLDLYPSASMAGIYTAVDNNRGVWKAPANVGVNLVSEPSLLLTDDDQENLNVDSVSGKSINAIRQFAGRGVLVWGARTLAGNDNEWRYINVRRLFIFVEESIKKATEFVVFEPNTASTWQRVKGMSEAFLTGLWRDGALAGATTKDAFFVRVGLGVTMTPDDILNGNMIVEIGLAAARPAEFIILRFSHKLQES